MEKGAPILLAKGKKKHNMKLVEQQPQFIAVASCSYWDCQDL